MLMEFSFTDDSWTFDRLKVSTLMFITVTFLGIISPGTWSMHCKFIAEGSKIIYSNDLTRSFTVDPVVKQYSNLVPF